MNLFQPMRLFLWILSKINCTVNQLQQDLTHTAFSFLFLVWHVPTFTFSKSHFWPQSPGNSGSSRVSLLSSCSPLPQSTPWDVCSEISPAEAVLSPAERQADGDCCDFSEGTEMLKMQLKTERRVTSTVNSFWEGLPIQNWQLCTAQR